LQVVPNVSLYDMITYIDGSALRFRQVFG
jgi:hypothetical protein